MKKANILALSAAVAGVLVSSASFAGVTANIGVATNYLWRGSSLSNEGPAVSGGVDYAHDSGIYAGVWQSSEGFVEADGGNATGETDLYAGYSGEAGPVSYDVGFVSYKYLQDDRVDFDEIYFSVGYDFVSFFYANSSDLETDYMSLTFEYDRYSLVYGDYAYDLDSTSDYSHFDLSAALTDELSITYSQSDITGDDDGRLVVSYGLEFEL